MGGPRGGGGRFEPRREPHGGWKQMKKRRASYDQLPAKSTTAKRPTKNIITTETGRTIQNGKSPSSSSSDEVLGGGNCSV